MFRQNLDDTSALGSRSNVPLEVAPGGFEDGIELVGDEFVGGEDAE